MRSEQLLWGIGWLILGCSAISLVTTQMSADPRVKLGMQLALGALTLVGSAKIWGFLP